MNEINEILFLDDFPGLGEAYKIGELNGRFFFAWGRIYLYAESLPEKNALGLEDGVRWYDTEDGAVQAFHEFVQNAFDIYITFPQKK